MAKVQVRVPIEVDITYVNKTWFTLKQKKGSNDKHYVIGFFQRGIANVKGKAVIKTIPDNNPETIHKTVIENTSPGCILYCQENLLPASLQDIYELHELKESDGHVRGDVHINNVNNMWRDLKRCIKREHISVSQKHLQSYCNEVAWRINHNHLSPSEKFETLFSAVGIGGRLTMQDLVNKPNIS